MLIWSLQSRKIKPVKKDFLQFPVRFGPVSGPFRPICSILDHRIRLGPCLVHLAAFLFHFSSEMCSQKIKPVKKDFLQFPVRLGLYLVRLGPYVPFWTTGFVWDHVWSILLHFCSISLQKCAHERSSQ